LQNSTNVFGSFLLEIKPNQTLVFAVAATPTGNGLIPSLSPKKNAKRNPAWPPVIIKIADGSHKRSLLSSALEVLGNSMAALTQLWLRQKLHPAEGDSPCSQSPVGSDESIEESTEVTILVLCQKR
jgi:hypothetical protein